MKMTVLIKQIDGGKPAVTTDQVMQALSKRFDNKESFCSRLDVHCLDIAIELGAVYTREPNDNGPDKYIFDFTQEQSL